MWYGEVSYHKELQRYVVQKRALHIIFNWNNIKSYRWTFRERKALSICNINRFTISILVYDWMLDMLPYVFDFLRMTIAILHPYQTLILQLPFICKPPSNTAIFQYSKIWNSLSDEFQKPTTINSLRKSIKNHFSSRRFLSKVLFTFKFCLEVVCAALSSCMNRQRFLSLNIHFVVDHWH